MLPKERTYVKGKQKYLHILVDTLQRVINICNLPHIYNDTFETVGKAPNRCFKIPVNNALNSSVDAYIFNTDSGEFCLKDKDQKLKLGKILGQLWPNLDSTQIEKAVTLWKATYTVDTTKVLVSDDIGGVYDISSVGGSCMAHRGEWMAIYEDLGCKIAYLLNDEGDLRARAILWDNNVYLDNDKDNVVTIMDRIFFRHEADKITLEAWAKEKGYLTSFTTDTRTCKGVYNGYDGVPYIDTMYTVIVSEVGGSWQLSNGYGDGYDTLQSTQGNSGNNCGISNLDNEDMVYCEDIGEDRHIEDVYFNETHDCYYAYDDDLVYLDGSWYHIDDDRICYTEDTCEYLWADDCYRDYDGDYFASMDELTETYDGELYYSNNYSFTYCDDIGAYVLDDEDTYYVEDLDVRYYSNCDLYTHADGTYWSSEEAYYDENPKEEEEDE